MAFTILSITISGRHYYYKYNIVLSITWPTCMTMCDDFIKLCTCTIVVGSSLCRCKKHKVKGALLITELGLALIGHTNGILNNYSTSARWI